MEHAQLSVEVEAEHPGFVAGDREDGGGIVEGDGMDGLFGLPSVEELAQAFLSPLPCTLVVEFRRDFVEV